MTQVLQPEGQHKGDASFSLAVRTSEECEQWWCVFQSITSGKRRAVKTLQFSVLSLC